MRFRFYSYGTELLKTKVTKKHVIEQLLELRHVALGMCDPLYTSEVRGSRFMASYDEI